MRHRLLLLLLLDPDPVTFQVVHRPRLDELVGQIVCQCRLRLDVHCTHLLRQVLEPLLPLLQRSMRVDGDAVGARDVLNHQMRRVDVRAADAPRRGHAVDAGEPERRSVLGVRDVHAACC